jgi:hypothetical protein
VFLPCSFRVRTSKLTNKCLYSMIGVYWSGGWGSVWLCTCVAATCVADCVRVPLGGSSYIHVCVCGGGGGRGSFFGSVARKVCLHTSPFLFDILPFLWVH